MIFSTIDVLRVFIFYVTVSLKTVAVRSSAISPQMSLTRQRSTTAKPHEAQNSNTSIPPKSEESNYDYPLASKSSAMEYYEYEDETESPNYYDEAKWATLPNGAPCSENQHCASGCCVCDMTDWLRYRSCDSGVCVAHAIPGQVCGLLRQGINYGAGQQASQRSPFSQLQQPGRSSLPFGQLQLQSGQQSAFPLQTQTGYSFQNLPRQNFGMNNIFGLNQLLNVGKK